LKKLANPQKLLIKANTKKNNTEINYSDLVDELINSKDLNPSEIRAKLDLIVSLREQQNNEIFKDIGLEYGFIKLSTEKSKGREKLYVIVSEKIPTSIAKIRKDIEDLKHSENRLGHGLGNKIKQLEKVMKKLQLIQVYDSIKTLSDYKGKGTTSDVILNSLKATGSAIGFAGILGMMAAPPTLPITGSMLVAGIALRSSSTLALFIKSKLKDRSVNKTRNKASELNSHIISSTEEIISALSEPIVAEKFPNTSKLFMESLNSISKSTNFTNSQQEKILQLFEEKVLEQIDTNPSLKSEWDNIKDFWENNKINFEEEMLSTGDSDKNNLRTLCEKPVQNITDFILDDIKNIKELENTKSIDEALDDIIDSKIYIEILSLSGIQKTGIAPADFIRQTIWAHHESIFQRENIANETLKNINTPNIVSYTLERMPELLASGKSDIQAKSIIAHEIDQLLHQEITQAAEKSEKLVASQKLVILGDKLRNSLMHMV
jgi:hypothetical protein